MNDAALLSDVFKKRENVNVPMRLDLYKNRLEITPLVQQSDQKAHVIDLVDLAGTLVERPFKTNDTSVYLIVNAYPRTLNNRLKRRKLTLEFAFDRHKHLIENFNRVNAWHERINALLNGDSVEVVLKPFLVFVNPVSGSGNARRLVLEHVLKVWNEANVKSRIVLTGEWYLCFG